MIDIAQKTEGFYKKNKNLIHFAGLLIAICWAGHCLGGKISDTNARIGNIEAAIYGDPLSDTKNGLAQRTASIEEALSKIDRRLEDIRAMEQSIDKTGAKVNNISDENE